MKKSLIKKITNLLKNEYAELVQKIELAKKDEIDIGSDEIDLIQSRILALATNQLVARNKQRMVMIENALKRIEENTFGECQECNEDIDEKRLMINPAFITCISCAEHLEMLKRKHGG